MATEEKVVKVNKWDGNAAKNALDDAAKKVMKDEFGMEESFMLMNGRLILCTVAVGFALFACLWDYLNPFPKSRLVLIVCVIAYFILTSILSIYLLFVEKNKFYVGLEKDPSGIDPDNTWTLTSNLKKYDDIYTLCLTFTEGTKKDTRSVELQRSIANFFDEKGNLCQEIYAEEIIKLKKSLDKGKKMQ